MYMNIEIAKEIILSQSVIINELGKKINSLEVSEIYYKDLLEHEKEKNSKLITRIEELEKETENNNTKNEEENK